MTPEEAKIKKLKINDVVVLRGRLISRIYRVIGFSHQDLSVYVRCRETKSRDRFHQDLLELYTGIVPDDLPVVSNTKLVKLPGLDSMNISTADVVGDSIKIISDESSSLMRAIKRGNIEDSDKSMMVEIYVKKILRHNKRKCEIIAVTGEISLIK